MQGLWEIGNKIIAAARDIQYNHASLAANQNLSDTRQWQYILDNQPFNLYNGYKLTLAGLMERALLSIAQLNRILLILLAVEGCALFLAAAVYIWYLMRQVGCMAMPGMLSFAVMLWTVLGTVHACFH